MLAAHAAVSRRPQLPPRLAPSTRDALAKVIPDYGQCRKNTLDSTGGGGQSHPNPGNLHPVHRGHVAGPFGVRAWFAVINRPGPGIGDGRPWPGPR